MYKLLYLFVEFKIELSLSEQCMLSNLSGWLIGQALFVPNFGVKLEVAHEHFTHLYLLPCVTWSSCARNKLRKGKQETYNYSMFSKQWIV